MGRRLLATTALSLMALFATAGWARADGPVGTTFPAGFPTIVDAAHGTPIIGYGGAGPVKRPPVIIVHGNNDTPYPTSCNASYGLLHNLAAELHAKGWALSELWGLGWQGEQCELQTNPPARSGDTHTVANNVADLRAFVKAVREFTGARRVDIVAHSLGSTLAREWMRQDTAYAQVRRFVGLDGTNHGIINCSPSPLNYYALPALGNFTPDSPLCQEVGSVRTPLMAALNAGDETPGPTEYTMVVNADKSFVYIAAQDGPFPPVPEQDRDGRPHSFARSASLDGARIVELTGQERYAAPATGTAHVGISNSPEAYAAVVSALSVPDPESKPRQTRRAPRGLSLKARRAGRAISVSGRLSLPSSTRPPSEDCAGTIRLTVSVGGRRVLTDRFGLAGSCTYRGALTLAQRHRRRAAVVRARFLGNATLSARSSRAVRVSAATTPQG